MKLENDLQHYIKLQNRFKRQFGYENPDFTKAINNIKDAMGSPEYKEIKETERIFEEAKIELLRPFYKIVNFVSKLFS